MTLSRVVLRDGLPPHHAGERVARDDLPRAPGQVQQQLELLRGQLHRPAGARHPARRAQSTTSVSTVRRSTSAGLSAAGHGADAGQQLGEGERLDDVVVRARIEPHHAVLERVARGQNNHRRLEAAAPDRREDLDAVPAGQTQVEQDEVETVRRQAKERRLAGGLDDHVVALALEPLAERLGHLPLVLDHEQAQRPRTGGADAERFRRRPPAGSTVGGICSSLSAHPPQT